MKRSLQMIPQQKGLILSFLELESLRAWNYREGFTCRKKTLKIKVNLTELSQDAKKKLIPPILFLYYELSVCPLLLNYNKVYLVSSLIAKPTKDPKKQCSWACNAWSSNLKIFEIHFLQSA